MFQVKVFEHLILYKKLSGHICLPPSGLELGAFKDRYVLIWGK